MKCNNNHLSLCFETFWDRNPFRTIITPLLASQESTHSQRALHYFLCRRGIGCFCFVDITTGCLDTRHSFSGTSQFLLSVMASFVTEIRQTLCFRTIINTQG